MKVMVWAAMLVMLAGCGNMASENMDPEKAKKAGLEVATFAGGCFWCVEAGFEKLPGVKAAVSGYSGGSETDPSYRQVALGLTGHTEAVQVYYDPEIISYAGLVQALWRMMDPTDAGGQFHDRGSQYRPAIFYHNEKQKRIAERAKSALAASGRYQNPVTIEITAFDRFYEAEAHHQDYYRKNPVRYKFYTFNSGRYQFVDAVWGKQRHVDFTRFRDDEIETGTISDQDMSYVKPSKAHTGK